MLTTKNLSVSKLVLRVIHVDWAKELLRSFFVIHELSLWNCARVKNPVPVGEIINLSIRAKGMKYSKALSVYLCLKSP